MGGPGLHRGLQLGLWKVSLPAAVGGTGCPFPPKPAKKSVITSQYLVEGQHGRAGAGSNVFVPGKGCVGVWQQQGSVLRAGRSAGSTVLAGCAALRFQVSCFQ